MTQAKMQAAVETAKAAVMVVREVDDPCNNDRPIYSTPR